MDYSSLLERGSLLLRVQPGVRPGQFDRHVREVDAQRLAVARSGAIQCDEQRSSLLVVGEGRQVDARRGVYAVNFEFPHPAVVADVQCPSVSRRVAALGRIVHLDFLGGTFPQRQFLLAGILNRSAGIPDDMEGKQKVVLIVVECGIDFVLHDRALARELGARVRDLDGVPVLVLPVVRDPVRLRLPDPGAGGLQPKRGPIDIERVADRLDLIPRVETVGLGNLVGDGRALLRRHTCRGTNHSDQQNTDHGNAACFRHKGSSGWEAISIREVQRHRLFSFHTHSFAAETATFEMLFSPAAARITAATSFGRDSMGTWLVGSDVTLALIFFAIVRWTSGWIIRSFSATMYQDGFVFHAALVTFSSKALPKMGPCVTAITFVFAAGKSGAKSWATPSEVR